MTEGLTGGCSCGAMRYRLTAPPMFVNCCHCTQCQRLTGSAFVVNALIETDRIEILAGTPQRTDGPSESGRPHDIYRCPACHTAVWSDYGRRGYLSFVRVGTLDDASSVAPHAHIFTRSKQPWVNLEGGAPAFEVFYDMNSLWPPESLARRKAAAGG
ncbi:MAG: GFA family protein [Alphaproteobacteria bacterium]|nr:GFA family protein [Alphaproteobacteria bacterium]MCW5739852.1 GFA family protein [Alphaproteobacteria bacterium]